MPYDQPSSSSQSVCTVSSSHFSPRNSQPSGGLISFGDLGRGQGEGSVGDGVDDLAQRDVVVGGVADAAKAVGSSAVGAKTEEFQLQGYTVRIVDGHRFRARDGFERSTSAGERGK